MASVQSSNLYYEPQRGIGPYFDSGEWQIPSTKVESAPSNYYNYHNSNFESDTNYEYYYDDFSKRNQSLDDYSDLVSHQNSVDNNKLYRMSVQDYDSTGPYSENQLDEKIDNIRHNDAIFRQDLGDFNTLANYAASAIKILSLILSVVGGGGGGGGGSGPVEKGSVDRIDPGVPTNEVDLALGTLMAFGGKYLRELAMYTWEHATQTPAEPLGVPSPSASVASVVQSTQPPQPAQTVLISSGKPYLSTISPQELENLGLKAVSAGADPTKLQQAFAAAQLNGDWTQLESEMAAVLGPEAVGLGGSGGGPDVLSQASQFIQNIVAPSSNDKVDTVSASPGVSTSQVPSGLAYYMTVANNMANRLTKVINGPDPNTPTYHLSEDEQIAQQSIITRFIKEFHLEKEALALQYQANSVIKQINNLIEGTPDNKIDKIGSDYDVLSAEGTEGSPAAGGLSSMISSIPNMVGQAAVSLIRFISPSPQKLEEKVDVAPSSGPSYSEIRPYVDVDTVTYAALGMGAIGTVLYGIYAAGDDSTKKRRTSYYKRSVDDQKLDATKMLWSSLQKYDDRHR